MNIEPLLRQAVTEHFSYEVARIALLEKRLLSYENHLHRPTRGLRWGEYTFSQRVEAVEMRLRHRLTELGQEWVENHTVLRRHIVQEILLFTHDAEMVP